MKRPSELGLLRASTDPALRAAQKLISEPMSGAEAVAAMTGGKWPHESEAAYRVHLAKLNLEQARRAYYERHQQYLDALRAAGEVPT